MAYTAGVHSGYQDGCRVGDPPGHTAGVCSGNTALPTSGIYLWGGAGVHPGCTVGQPAGITPGCLAEGTDGVDFGALLGSILGTLLGSILGEQLEPSWVLGHHHVLVLHFGSGKSYLGSMEEVRVTQWNGFQW